MRRASCLCKRFREHRLYQADWLVRFYGFAAHELTPESAPNLDLTIDPKLAWALRHRGLFPVDLNKAPRHLLLRVPGPGTKSVLRILQIRRWHQPRLEDLARLHLPLKKLLPFVTTADENRQTRSLESDDLLASLVVRPRQLDLLALEPSVISGQL